MKNHPPETFQTEIREIFQSSLLIDENETAFVCQTHPHFKFQVGNININCVIYMSIAVNKRIQEIRMEEHRHSRGKTINFLDNQLYHNYVSMYNVYFEIYLYSDVLVTRKSLCILRISIISVTLIMRTFKGCKQLFITP